MLISRLSHDISCHLMSSHLTLISSHLTWGTPGPHFAGVLLVHVADPRTEKSGQTPPKIHAALIAAIAKTPSLHC